MIRQKISVLVLVFVFSLFLVKDIALFRTIQSITFNANTSQPCPQIYAKTVMLDHVNNYIMSPLSREFEDTIHLTARFPSLTANQVSYFGVLVAVVAARVVLSDTLCVRRLAVGLFLVRQFVDDLDGLVARIRIGMDRNVDVSITGTTGYAVDGICDAIGFTVFVVAVFAHSLRNTNYKYKPIIDGDGESRAKRLLLRNYALFGLQMALSCVLWNRYIDVFHRLLEVHPSVTTVQIFKSRLQWLIMWLWRCYGNAHQLMIFFLMSVWLNRSDQFVQCVHFIGFVALIGLSFLTEMHLNDIENYLADTS
ncbi:unnamed protein product [Medioppia subpectinata]|uniref:Ceramide phosphoethanolamine synthase n=1 Tax=Medioppia subpectinata TaxID=1979941 RepID=A0A7R9Q6K4_9ACAR|nr:unnamed protein product [Medioppia subpectinata]CAG2113334.1 unnamed protein product [Medioppia subpectinata]